MTRYRARLATRCSIHDKDFVCFQGERRNHSYGCPICVAQIRDAVQKLRATPHRSKQRKRVTR
jgi:hypothetical protein